MFAPRSRLCYKSDESAQLLHQQSIHLPRIGLALAGLHDRADQAVQGFGVTRLELFHVLGVGGQHIVDDLFQLAGVIHLLEAFGFDDGVDFAFTVPQTFKHLTRRVVADGVVADAADYRYFPDPDLPPLLISREWVQEVKNRLPKLQKDRASEFLSLRQTIEAAYNKVVHGLTEYDAYALVANRAQADFFEAVVNICHEPKISANWILGEVSRRLNAAEMDFERMPVSAAQLAAMIMRIQDGTINNNTAKLVFEGLWNGEGEVDAIIEAKGLKQINDTGALEAIIDEVLAANPKNVEEFKAGNTKALNGLVGPIMKASKGKANPAQVNELLMKKLG
jgi:Glu-tRNA(Gln) amidotransferase subunit E-like FAD-binding protein